MKLAMLALTAGLLLSPLPWATGHSPTAPAKSQTQLQLFDSHIKHIVVVVLENHAFDNEFGTYCQAKGKYCPSTVVGYPAGLCAPLNPSSASACVKPWPFTRANWTITQPMLHDQVSSLSAWNNSSDNNFYLAERSGLDPFGYYSGSTVPTYWDLAEEYGLGDNFFSSTLSYSLPNHWFLVAGQAPPISEQFGFGDRTGGFAGNASDRATYYREANNTTSVEDLLLHHPSVSWKYYDYALQPNLTDAQNISAGPGHLGSAIDYWNPQAGKYESYGHLLRKHFVWNPTFFQDAAAGNLPQLSWVIPFHLESDHPPANVTTAESWLASVVDAVESSPNWNSTALFVTWDDYGGWYDQVAPPLLNGTSLSFRVPLLVISPYTPAGTVDSSQGYFESLLHLMEVREKLGCITPRDCYAPLPLGFFNFSMRPRAPLAFSTNATGATYPMALQAPDAPWQAVPFSVSSYFANDHGDGADVD